MIWDGVQRDRYGRPIRKPAKTPLEAMRESLARAKAELKRILLWKEFIDSINGMDGKA